MDKKIRYSGKAVFYGKETIFDFDGTYLHLYVDLETYQKLTMRDCGNGVSSSELQELSIDHLDCSINGSIERVIFTFSKTISKCNSQNYQIFTISLYVHNYIEYHRSGTLQNTDYVMVYYSKDLMKCLSLTPFYNISFEPKEGEPIATVMLNSDSCKKVSYSMIMGYEIEISPTYRKKWSGCNFDFIPGVKLKIKNAPELSYDTQLKFYHAFIKLLKFIFMRDNMMPEMMEFQYLGVQGYINSNHYPDYEKEVEDANDIYSSFIYWNSIYDVAGNLLKEIMEDNILLKNIPEKRINRISINDVTISKDAAEFEFEFQKKYPNGIPHSEKRIEIENAVKEKIEILKNSSTGIEKDYYKQFIKHVKQESLKGNMQYLFEENKEILSRFKSKLELNMDYNEISEECAGIRNTIDHGKKDKEITSDTAACYVLLRMLIYSMQLKRIGLEEGKIVQSIESLYKLKELGGLML